MRIVCPHCGLEKEFPDHGIPADAEIATCPRCKHRFRFRTLEPEPGQQPISQDAKTPEPGPRTAWSKDQEQEIYSDVPFERLDKFELIPAIILTIRQVMLESPAFFSRMPTNAGYARPLLFYLIISITQLFVRLLEVKYLGTEDLFLGNSTYWSGSEGQPKAVSWQMISFTLAISPVLFTMALALYSALAHLFLTLFQAANSGFQATLRVLAYGSAPSILAVIPVIGPMISLLWSLAAIFIGLRYAHQTSFTRVGLSLLALVIIALGVISYLLSAATTTPLPAGLDIHP